LIPLPKRNIGPPTDPDQGMGGMGCGSGCLKAMIRRSGGHAEDAVKTVGVK